MSLKKNIFANFLSQFYITLIGIILVPLYIRFMGVEAYGLIGFFAMLQAWFSLLDMGLTATIARETARFRGGATDALSYRCLVRALEVVFLIVALIGGFAMVAAADYIAQNWLQASQLPIAEVQSAVKLMAITISMRWMCGFYRGTISGSERFVWLSEFNSMIATLRFVGVLPFLIFVDATPSIFFKFQFGVAAIELTGLVFFAYRLLPNLPHGKQAHLRLTSLKPIIKFSAHYAFVSTAWVLVTQTDKLVLSKILPLAQYGYFTLAVVVAGGVFAICGPISGTLMPRMSKLEAEGDHAGTIRVYRKTTQLVAILAGSASITLAFCAEPLLWAWTGDRYMAHQAAPILSLYALGNGVLTIAAFPFYLQYAKGNLRLHLIGNAVFVIILIPSTIWAASQFGGKGAGYVWLVMNLLSFVAWLPLVHRKVEPGLNLKWYGQDTLVIFLAAIVVGYCASNFLPQCNIQELQLAEVILIGVITMVASAMASSFFRSAAQAWIENKIKNIKKSREYT